MADNNIASCPLCPFTDSDADFVSQHIEFCHPEIGVSGFLQDQLELTGQNSAPLPNEEYGADKYVDCPHGCGETIATAELSSHLDLHVAEDVALDAFGTAPARSTAEQDVYDDDRSFDDEDSLDMPDTYKGGKRGMQRDSSRANTAKPPRPHSPPRTTNADGIKRLGRSELGPHAHEKKMPSWLKKMLEKGGSTSKQTQITSDGKLTRRETVENETDHVIPALVQLCDQDKSVQRAFFCSPKVRHICKMRHEGGFCGYRNIQMVVSWLQKSRAFGYEHFPPKGPTILELQDMIESAWDMGFNSSGRAETGGIKDTRKFIGTPEAQALFMSLGIPCEARSISSQSDLRACDALYIDIANYFRSGCSLEDQEAKIHQGHSMTIVGFEIRDNGSANLLVFDPMFKTSPAMERLIAASVKPSDPTRLLKAYRRGTPYLQKYKIFELLNCQIHVLIKSRLCIASPKPEMRTSPNIIITGTPGVGKTVHCEQLAQEIGLKHLSINQIAKDRGCFDEYDEELKTWVVDEDKLLDALEDEIPNGGYLIDWHACDLFPKSWIDLVVVLRCPTTDVLYDRLSSRGYHEKKLEENLDAEIFGVLIDEAREAFDEEIVVELTSEQDSDVDSNCQRISQWVDSWKQTHVENAD
ncbi:hypothetical protein N7457_002437 [Penicillium paradoxum]|uniref:uncharacterized protein n=1 Tax=Penicillium paradoxum TaxID=176176 RepID=UPI002548E810|nr:uncharacterized protein N7457_002437 [Penicillium paradoxum]KAJ5787447.1 hypothetical protein N7457_002437 [Penicillium paradoxum]